MILIAFIFFTFKDIEDNLVREIQTKIGCFWIFGI